MEKVMEFATARERDDHLIGVLENIRKTSVKALAMDQRVIDEMVYGCVVHAIEKNDLDGLGIDIDLMLEKVAELKDRFVYDDWDSNYLMEFIYGSLVSDHGNSRVFSLFKQSRFACVRIYFTCVNTVIASMFDEVNLDNFKKTDQMIIQRMQQATANIFVNDPNIWGDDPYYEDNLYELYRSAGRSIEHINDLFNNYIGYFEEDEETDE